MAKSPTQCTLDKWRKLGYMCEVVEKTIPKTFIKKDLFGFVDVLAVGHGETVAIQTTSADHVSHRGRKIEDMPERVAELRNANWRLVVEGWKKPGHRWECREVDIS